MRTGPGSEKDRWCFCTLVIPKRAEGCVEHEALEDWEEGKQSGGLEPSLCPSQM